MNTINEEDTSMLSQNQSPIVLNKKKQKDEQNSQETPPLLNLDNSQSPQKNREQIIYTQKDNRFAFDSDQKEKNRISPKLKRKPSKEGFSLNPFPFNFLVVFKEDDMISTKKQQTRQLLEETKQIEEDSVSSSSSSTSSSSSFSDGGDRPKLQKANTNFNRKRQLKRQMTAPHLRTSFNRKRKRVRKQRTDQQWDMKMNFYLDRLKVSQHFRIDYNELKFIKKIGQGGYGEVYHGKWLEQDVAIKQYGEKKQKCAKKVANFLKEVEVISSLRHPNIILYQGVCINQRIAYMITEFVEKNSLFDYLHVKKQSIPPECLVQVCEDIALGMRYLHDRNVLHCDLKSQNILIDNGWNLKLCDFGLSRTKKKCRSKIGKRIGTVNWMSPEILRQEKYTENSDVYSYGVILWEMMAGKIPYQKWKPMQIVGKVGYGNASLPIPREGNPLIIKIIKQCLQKDRYSRPNFKQILTQIQSRDREQEKRDHIMKQLKFFLE